MKKINEGKRSKTAREDEKKVDSFVTIMYITDHASHINMNFTTGKTASEVNMRRREKGG